MTATVAAVLILMLLVVAAVYVSRFLAMRAVRVIVSVFRKQGATDAESAKSLDELGLAPAGLLGGMFKGRDYRPHALRVLGQAGIIRAAEGGRFYLSERALDDSQIKKLARIK